MNITLQTNILPKEQLELYPYLKEITKLNFILFGGTALALQLGHRVSVDFDFFNADDITKIQEKLLNLKGIKVSQITMQENNTLIFKTQSGVKFSFFGNLDFVRLSNYLYSDDEMLKLADLTTLLTTKLKATCDRAEYKNYIDIIAILKTKKLSLQEALQEIPNYFGSNYPLINIAKGLTYFEDGDLHRLSDEEKKFLCKQVNNLNFEKMQDYCHANLNKTLQTQSNANDLTIKLKQLNQAESHRQKADEAYKNAKDELRKANSHNENLQEQTQNENSLQKQENLETQTRKTRKK